MNTILLMNGPNLNLLGTRETQTYGSDTLQSIESRLTQKAAELSVTLKTFQDNSEGRLIDKIHESATSIDFILLNPGAYTHTSIALRDALTGVSLPFIELHISNIYQREPFRKTSYFSDIAQGVILGFGTMGYDLALEAAVNYLKSKPSP